MGKLRVYCLKTLNKLSIYPLDKTPSAPSVFCHLNRQRNDINALKEQLEQLELRVKALELANKLMSKHMDNMVDKLCFCTQAEATSQVDCIV